MSYLVVAVKVGWQKCVEVFDRMNKVPLHVAPLVGLTSNAPPPSVYKRCLNFRVSFRLVW